MKDKHFPIYLYPSNIVDYFRLIFLFTGLFLIKVHPIFGVVCFISNLLLDALDGYLARRLNQVSSFGAILDYTIDRVSFATYVVILVTIYPNYLLLLCICLNLDLLSHFFHLQSCYALNKASHKDVTKDEPLILHIYYKKVVLGATCLTHDLFFICLYLYAIYPTVGLGVFLCFMSVGVLFKTVVHITQITCAARNLLSIKKII